MNSYGDFAKHYIQKGISVIPDKWESKQPAIKGWTDYCRRMPTDEEVRQWSGIGNTNIAVACGEASGVIALDLDTEDTQLLDIIRDFMPESPVERIGSKGWVRFFRYNGEPSEIVRHNGNIVFEILSSNKKVTIPPSQHPDGMPYRWKNEDLLNIDVNKLPYLPPMFLTNIKHVLKCASPSTTFDGNKIINGRFDALQSECGKLIKEGLPLDDAIRKLIELDEKVHESPYFSDSSEHYHTEPFTNALKMYASCLDSFNKKHMERSEEYEIPLTASAVNEEYKELVLKKKELQKESKEGESVTLEPKDGVLYDLQKFVLSNSFIKQPSFALSASLALIGTLIGRKVMFNGNATNLYILNVAPSGAGKDAPQQCIKNIFIDLKLEAYLGSGDYVSDASLMDSLPNTPVRLDIIDEASGLLTSVNKGANTFDGKMADILCELYTSSSSKFLGRALANGEIKGAVDRPCVSLLMSTTPRGFSDSLSIKAVEKGLLGRTLIFQGNPHNAAERVSCHTELSHKAQTQLREIASYEPEKKDDFKIGGITQGVTVIGTDKEAAKLLDDIFREFDDLRRDQNEDSLDLPIIARMFQQLCKIAAIHSISRGLTFEVNKDDVEFAYKLVKLNLENFGVVLKENVHDSFEDAYISKVRGYLDRNGKRSMRKILKGVKYSLPASKKRSIIEMMVKLNIITATYIKGDMLYENADNKE